MPAEDVGALIRGLRPALREWHGFGVPTYHPIRLRPSLAWALVPKQREREDRDPDPGRPAWGPRPIYGDTGRLCRLMAAGAAAGAQPPLGLVDGGNSDASPLRRRRKGTRGLTSAGGRFLEDFCSLVRVCVAMYGMWTVTLPVEVACELSTIPNGWQRFADVIRRRFSEEHKRACDREGIRRRCSIPSHWAFVVEPQKNGRPHMHFVFRSKARRGTSWLLGKGRLDRIIRNAFRTVTGTAYPVTAAGNVQALRSSPGAYLSKYLRKGTGDNGANVVLWAGWGMNLLPAHWWGCSKSARAYVREHVLAMPDLVANWLSREWPQLVAAGAIDARLWEPEAPGAPAIVCGRWRSADHLVAVLDHLLCLAETPYPA